MEMVITNNNLIQTLPYELIHIIFMLLDMKSQLNLILTSKFFFYCKEFFIIDKWVRVNNFHIEKLYYDNLINIVINENIKRYPKKVTHLTFGWDFNQPIKNCLLVSLTHLTFDGKFDQLIKDCLPASLTHLTFGFHFDQPIKDCLPS